VRGAGCAGAGAGVSAGRSAAAAVATQVAPAAVVVTDGAAPSTFDRCLSRSLQARGGLGGSCRQPP